MCAELCVSMVGSDSTASNASSVASKHPRERGVEKDPKCENSGAGGEETGPEHAKPDAGADGPTRVKNLSSGEAPGCKGSSTADSGFTQARLLGNDEDSE